MANYAFRVTATFLSLKSFIEELLSHSQYLAIYEHSDTKRPHIHGYVEGLDVSTDTLKNWIKKALNIKAFPKSDWEFATKISKGNKKGQPVDRESLIYFHKGKYPILVNKGFTQEEVDNYHALSYTPPTEYVKEKVQYKLISESKSQAHKRQKDLLEEMKSEYAIKKTVNPYVSQEDMISIVNTVVDKNNIIMGLYKRMDFLDTLESQLGRSRIVDEMRATLERRRRV